MERNKDGSIKTDFQKKLDESTNGGKLKPVDLPQASPTTSLGMQQTISKGNVTMQNLQKRAQQPITFGGANK